MKISRLAIAVAASIAFVSSANAANQGSWTIGAATGWAHAFDYNIPNSYRFNDVRIDSDGYAFKLYGEYNFTNWFGLGLAYDYINEQGVKFRNDYNSFAGPNSGSEFHSNIAELYGKFAYTFGSEGSDLFFKIGPTCNWTTYMGSTSAKVGAVIGVGANFAIDRNLGVRVGYDYFYNVARTEFVKADTYPYGDDSSKDRIDEGLLYVGLQYSFGGEQAPAAPTVVRMNERHSLDAGVLFPFDSSVMSAEGKEAVSHVVTSASKFNNPSYEVYGYTDRIGSDAYNNKLSQKRADAVSAELANNGAHPTVSEGRGKSSPVTGDKCDGIKKKKDLINCLAPDRRVEVLVSGDVVVEKKD